jgi:uncharacterized protein (DUF433 family)
MKRITTNPNQCGGRPCIRGMRIRVKDVLDMLADGATQEEILADFPDLEAADIQASIAYAARYMDHPVLAPPRAMRFLPEIMRQLESRQRLVEVRRENSPGP